MPVWYRNKQEKLIRKYDSLWCGANLFCTSARLFFLVWFVCASTLFTLEYEKESVLLYCLESYIVSGLLTRDYPLTSAGETSIEGKKLKIVPENANVTRSNDNTHLY